jgi:glycosyltransferase involved in cell wall biosynthesis
MPRVLRILNRMAVGGPVLNATLLTRYMAPEFETLLLVGEREGHEQSADYLADRLGISFQTMKGMGRAINPLSDFSVYGELKKLIRQFRPDIVHTHAAKPGALGRLAAAAAGVPVIVHTFHGHVFHSYFSPLKSKVFIQTERFLARRSSAIIAISEQQRRELVEDFRIAPADKFHVVPLGFDLDRFRTGSEEKRARFRSEFGLDEDAIAIGIIGRLVPVKNHGLFLDALRKVLNKTGKKVKAFLIGDGDARPGLEEKARQLGIPFSVHTDSEHPHPLVFTSWRSDVDTIMAGLDIICLTSFNEGTPVSLIEAQAASRPIVSTRVGGIADIVKEGETALLAGVEEEEAYADHLLRLVEDDALRHRMGAGSSPYVMERFSYQRLVRDTSALYHHLLNTKY